jgi:hypothetical protein
MHSLLIPAMFAVMLSLASSRFELRQVSCIDPTMMTGAHFYLSRVPVS